jgi:uncharacterized protein
MNSRSWNPRRLDVEAFARQNAELQGSWPLQELDRLMESAHPGIAVRPDQAAAWSARGEWRPVRSAPPQCWLHVAGEARLALVCQRCLGPVETIIRAERSLLFVPDEETAVELDAEVDDDVLAMTRSLDLRALIEDEFLLNLPLVPRHDVCPQPLAVPVTDEGAPEERRQPFAALAALKRGGPVD